MPKYMVAITEVVEYLVPVTAADEESAGELAMDKIVNTRNRDKWCTDVTAREVDGVNSVARKKPWKNLAGYDGPGAQSSRA